MDDRHPTFDPAPGRLVASLSGDAPVRRAPPPGARDAAFRPSAPPAPAPAVRGAWLAVALGVGAAGLAAAVVSVVLGLAAAALIVGG